MATNRPRKKEPKDDNALMTDADLETALEALETQADTGDVAELLRKCDY